MSRTRTTLRRMLADDVAKLPSVRDAALERARVIAEDARRRVPEGEGIYRRTVRAEMRDGRATVVMGTRKAFFGHLIEFGGGNHTAAAPLRRAAEAAGIYRRGGTT